MNRQPPSSLRATAPTTYFLTFSCDGRRHWLADPAVRDALMQLLRDDCATGQIALHAWVIMTNHVHTLASGALQPTLPWVGSVKKRFALRRRPMLRSLLPPEAVHGAFWLPGGGYPFRVWSHQKYTEKARYIHENPVRSKLCARMSHWRWSSAIDVYGGQRQDAPRLSARPESLVDLLWWNQPCLQPRPAESRAR